MQQCEQSAVNVRFAGELRTVVFRDPHRAFPLGVEVETQGREARRPREGIVHPIRLTVEARYEGTQDRGSETTQGVKVPRDHLPPLLPQRSGNQASLVVRASQERLIVEVGLAHVEPFLPATELGK